MWRLLILFAILCSATSQPRIKGAVKRGPQYAESMNKPPKTNAVHKTSPRQKISHQATDVAPVAHRPFTISKKSNNTLAPDLHDSIFHSRFATKKRSKPVNVLLILADDLGFGDTSVEPFIGTGIRTPRLEKMAARGAILTNFRAAAPTCTPSRASLLTGMYPWRAGIKSVFEYGERGGKSNRDDWLVQVPTAPMLFAENGYKTFHSGKWHLGGMRNDDYSMRMLREKSSVTEANARRCPHPGPNQQGFQTYVSVLDGPGAPRQNELQVHDTLYSQGCGHLLENDNPLPSNAYNISGYLTNCEAKHAMRAMSDSVKANVPFYIHLWFHAPHGPWEFIPGYDSLYPNLRSPQSAYDKDLPNCNSPNARRFRYCYIESSGNKRRINDRGMNRLFKYMTMVSDMDAQIGMVLDHIDQLGIAKDTIIVFTSDNGPEDDAGSSGGLRDRKRSIHEGGIRVPAFVQWEGTIPAGSVVNTMAVSTDIFPTFLDAAGISLSDNYRIDGSSILPDLLGASRLPEHGSILAGPLISGQSSDVNSEVNAVDRISWLHLNNIPVNRTAPSASNPLGLPQETHPFLFAPLQLSDSHSLVPAAIATANVGAHSPRRRVLRRQLNQERLFLWHADFESPRRTAGIAYGFKIILDENDIPIEIFDLSIDPREQDNLLSKLVPGPDKNSEKISQFFKNFVENWPNNQSPKYGQGPSQGLLTTLQEGLSTLSSLGAGGSKQENWSRAHILHHRQDSHVLYQVLFHLYPALRAFATHGSDGYKAYQEKYPELRYPPTPPSHERPMITNIYKIVPRERMSGVVDQFLQNNLCNAKSPCSCKIPQAKHVSHLPFPTTIGKDAVASTIAVPHGYINASVLLFDHWF